MAYSKTDKARAVSTYLAEGATAAALAVGCSRESVYVWLAESDTDPKKGEETRAATAERLARKRAAMVELFHDRALELAAAIDPADPATARFAVPACALADKALMLAGLIRKSTDPARMSLAELEAWIAEMEAEMIRQGKPLPADRASYEMDREMERMKAELERKVATELFDEINDELSRSVHTPEELERNKLMGNVVRRHLDRPQPYNGDHPPSAA